MSSIDSVVARDSEHIRYGGPKLKRTSALVTFRDGNTIFFGISRCNPQDLFTKENGKRLARFRADVASRNHASHWKIADGCFLHSSGLLGQVPVDKVKRLLSYFDNLDSHFSTQNGRDTRSL